MLTKTVVINNPTGLHLRPAGNLCKEAVKYKSKITFNYRNNNTNAKSVLSVLAACVKCGDEIEHGKGNRGRTWRDRGHEAFGVTIQKRPKSC